ncbi:MAG: hypothetical protein IT304_01000, partial [Dehalococcoidia bacterium]|nr:hypothetical protein [Dehalococcoidia bacterium]
PPDLSAFFMARAGSPLKSQATGSDLRAERLVRQVRGEVEELRRALRSLQDAPEQMTEIDVDAVAANPEGACALPPALLVRALVQMREQQARLERQNAGQRRKLEAARARARALKRERAFLRGRMQTFDEVLGALHANLVDLRAQRDAMLGARLPERQLRVGPDALPRPGAG